MVCAPHIVRSHYYIHVIIRIKFLIQYYIIIVFIGKIVQQPVNQNDNNNKNRMTRSALQQ